MEKERKTNSELALDELGKYLIDISKLIFGGIILAGIMRLEIDPAWLFGAGMTAVLMFMASGFIFILVANSKK